ncbi:hypothetical protein [Sulfurospirillum arcachonense]|uniref:hypothetical protein n=1 Tax=Sulfurospirillum arcachonense TaxID=57666 RepID=UPI000467FB17|nr:hypothetical protein [Sulfurospirillum arcachonense]
MSNLVIKFILLCVLSLSAYANTHITTFSPPKDAKDIPENVKIQITFDNPKIIKLKGTGYF